jgi:hypothetical protein
MRDMVQKQKERRGPIVQIANEPTHQGKPLGEWLGMWQDETGLSTNAVEALHQMGTNMIPAMLARITYKEPVFNLDDYEVGMGGLKAKRTETRPTACGSYRAFFLRGSQ